MNISTMLHRDSGKKRTIMVILEVMITATAIYQSFNDDDDNNDEDDDDDDDDGNCDDDDDDNNNDHDQH